MGVVGKRLFNYRLFETIRYRYKYFDNGDDIINLSIPVYIIDDVHQYLKDETLDIINSFTRLFQEDNVCPSDEEMFIEFYDESYNAKLGLYVKSYDFTDDAYPYGELNERILKSAAKMIVAAFALFDNEFNIFDLSGFELVYFVDNDGILIPLSDDHRKAFLHVSEEYLEDPDTMGYITDMAYTMSALLLITIIMINRDMVDIEKFNYDKKATDNLYHFFDMHPHDNYRKMTVKPGILDPL